MGINFSFLCNKYGFAPNGVLHIGAHFMEERESYTKNGVNNIIWVEANVDVFNEIRFLGGDGELFFNYAISNVDNEICRLNITNNSQSSSILELDKHKIYHPDVWVVSQQQVLTKTIDTLLKEESLEAKRYNFVNLDIQGAEYLALLGARGSLNDFDYIYTEVNEAHLYKDCGLVTEIDSLLGEFGFKRTETDMSQWEWGDAFYIR